MTSREREWSAFADRIAIEGRALEAVHAEMRADLARIFMMICDIWAKLDALEKRKSGSNGPADSGV